MKHYLPLLLLSAVTLSAPAQDKISLAGRQFMEQYSLGSLDSSEKLMLSPMSADSQPAIQAIVTLSDENDAGSLESLGFTARHIVSDIFVVTVPLARMDELAALDCVRSIDFGRQASPMMDYARPSAAVDEAQAGFSFATDTHSFSGKGVVAGLYDTGLDPNHCNFRDANGTTRVKRLWHMTANDGTSRMYSSMTVRTFTTDNASESHATHVAGIMAGSYNGAGTYITLTEADGGYTRITRNEGNVPYYGVATEADLAMGCGALYLPNILEGVSNIIQYAEDEGQPVVVNLSLGSTDGPHDGTDSYTRALSELGKRGIICMSAGNDGDANMSLSKTFRANDLALRTSFTANTANGIVDIWGSDDTPFSVTWGVYTTATGTVTPLISLTGAGQSGSTSGNTAFSSYFTGTISAVSGVDANNHRYNVRTSVALRPGGGSTGRFIVLIIEGAAGKSVNVFGGTNVTFATNSLPGYTAGNARNSINNSACGSNILSVGSYTSRTIWPVLNTNDTGGAYQYNSSFVLGDISPFSSYGTDFAGRQLPLATGPGAAIISSFSTPYIQAGNAAATAMAARVTYNGRLNYWGEMQGTSMSCPFVAGTVALWLEANPSLTFNDIMDVIENASVQDDFTESRQSRGRWGAGKIDAVKGLKYILENKPAAIGTVWDDDNLRFIVSATQGGYDVTLVGEAAFEVTVTDMQGRTVATAAGRDGSAKVRTDSLQSGIYIISARGASASHSTKIAIR